MRIETDVNSDQHLMPERTTSKSGPEPDRLKIEGDWEEAMKRALGKKRPPEGWPRPSGKMKRAKKDAK